MSQIFRSFSHLPVRFLQSWETPSALQLKMLFPILQQIAYSKLDSTFLGEKVTPIRNSVAATVMDPAEKIIQRASCSQNKGDQESNIPVECLKVLKLSAQHSSPQNLPWNLHTLSTILSHVLAGARLLGRFFYCYAELLFFPIFFSNHFLFLSEEKRNSVIFVWMKCGALFFFQL